MPPKRRWLGASQHIPDGRWVPLPAPRRLNPARIERVRYLSQRSCPGTFDLPDDRQDVGCVLIGRCFVCYSSGLVGRLTRIGELRVSKGNAAPVPSSVACWIALREAHWLLM
jgi:hypothetical protein